MKKALIPLCLICGLALANESGPLVNDCHDQAQWARIDALLRAHPTDTLVIRTYAMRVGICRLIDDGKISMETGIRLFDLERQRAIMERSIEDDAKRERPKSPAEDAEPLG